MSEIPNLLAQLDAYNAPNTKQASAQQNSAPTQDRVAAAQRGLQEALSAASPNNKTASFAEPSDDAIAALQKTAAETAAAEQNALLKEAELYGAAVADGFLRSIHQHAEYAQKIAQHQPELYAQKVAQQQQYLAQQQQMRQPTVKSAQDDAAEGALEGITKIAAVSIDAFERGAAQAHDLVLALSSRQ